MNGLAEPASLANGGAAAAQATASSSLPTPSTSAAASSSLYPTPRKDKSFFKKVKSKEKARMSALAKTGEEPIWFDIVEILGKEEVDRIMQADGGKGEWVERFPRDAILEGRVRRLSAHGESGRSISRRKCCAIASRLIRYISLICRSWSYRSPYERLDSGCSTRSAWGARARKSR